jgi:hypothetical protein
VYSKIAFYIIAHEDDWQLFMNLNAYCDLVNSNCKVVIIHTTAGDDGQGPTYWQPRETGAISSARFCLAPLNSSAQGTTGTRTFNNHTVNYWSACNATCYFMRLPDGNGGGTGFPLYHNQSLTYLENGTITQMTAVDQSTAYDGWSDLCQTIQEIIQTESSGGGIIQINYQDPDSAYNPGDHADHYATGNATGTAVQNMGTIPNLQQALFVDYAINWQYPADLTGEDLFWKSGMFAAYEEAMYNGSGHSTISEGTCYIEWCLRSAHYRTINQTQEAVGEKVLASAIGPFGFPADKLPTESKIRT